jgi:hypothetical protein
MKSIKNIVITVISFVVTLIFVVIGGGIGKEFGKSLTNKYIAEPRKEERRKQLHSVLLEVSLKVNETLPIMIDKETKLFSTSIANGNTFQYNNMLVNYTHEEINPLTLKNNQKDKINNLVCTSDDMKFIVKHGIPVSYAYFGKNKNYITKIVIQTNRCNL